jgi:hypothetical protein
MSFFLIALCFALVVGTLRALSLAAERPDPRARAANSLASSRPAAAVPEGRAAWPLASRARAAAPRWTRTIAPVR